MGGVLFNSSWDITWKSVFFDPHINPGTIARIGGEITWTDLKTEFSLIHKIKNLLNSISFPLNHASSKWCREKIKNIVEFKALSRIKERAVQVKTIKANQVKELACIQM